VRRRQNENGPAPSGADPLAAAPVRGRP